VVTEVVIVTSTNHRAGAKTAEAATIVGDGGARAKAMEAAVKFAAVEATTAKAATAEATAAMAAATTTTTACQRHGRRGQANSCNSQRDYCLSQHLIFKIWRPAQTRRWRLFWSIAMNIGVTASQLDASLS
jgi:hypothetical protein